jgi:diguanylate cyclase (GGDEF)-like protein
MTKPRRAALPAAIRRAGRLAAPAALCLFRTPAAQARAPETTSALRISASPAGWWSLPHTVGLVMALATAMLVLLIWALALRHKLAGKAAQLAAARRLEQERSRLLTAIHSGTPLPLILTDICETFGVMSSGLRFAGTIDAVLNPADDGEEQVVVGDRPRHALFEAALSDPRGRQIGTFRAGYGEERLLSQRDLELATMAAGLANLAVLQSRFTQEFRFSATHDELTSLPNSRSSDVSLAAALADAVSSGTRVALVYVDVDQFRQVNEQYGRKIGDLYLQQVAERLMAAVRSTDKVARVGGDEFLLVAKGLHSADDAEAYRERLGSCFAHSFFLEERRVGGSASIGIAVYPDHGTTAEDLKRHADFDLYSAKHMRRAPGAANPEGPVETPIFSPTDLLEALDCDRFQLFYQPQFSSRGELKGLEALLRLRDPILGTVTPDTFIAVAERHELMLQLGLWVLRRALADAALWRLQDMPQMCMVVNVAGRELESPGYASSVFSLLSEADYPPDRLELEITERNLMRNTAEAERQLALLRSRGVRVAIDDFGTEYSCLSSLQSLPLDTVKIDRSFVRSLRASPDAMRTLEAMISLAHSLRKRVVVDGVETEREFVALSQLGEMDFQGFFLGRPEPAEVTVLRLAGWQNGFRRGSGGLPGSGIFHANRA